MERLAQVSNMKRELLFFIIIGSIGTFIDFLFYWSLQHTLSYGISKTISFCIGSVSVYLLNKFITFQQYERSLPEIMRFTSLYAATLIANVAANSVGIFLLSNTFSSESVFSHQQIIVLAFLAATGISAVLNFCGQKLWVFKST